jgi:hypothetical protein
MIFMVVAAVHWHTFRGTGGDPFVEYLNNETLRINQK